MHVRIRQGSELQNDLVEDIGLGKDITQCKHWGLPYAVIQEYLQNQVSSSRHHIKAIFNNAELTHCLFIIRSHNNLKYPTLPVLLANSLNDKLKKKKKEQ